MNKLIPSLLIVSGLILGGCSSVSDNRPDVVRKSEYYLEHGVDAFNNSDYVTAADFFNKALAHYRSIDDTHGILLSLINLSETAMATGNSQAVLLHLDEAEKVAKRTHPPRYLPRLQLLRAQVYWREHDLDKVMPLLSPLLPAFSNDNQPEKTPTLIELTAIILRTDIAFASIGEKPDEAVAWLDRLENSLRRNSDTTPLHDARLNRFKALMANRKGNSTKALAILNQALEQYREAAVRPAIAATLTEMARIYMSTKQWQQAETHLKRALYIRVWILDRLGSREDMLLLSAVYEELGNSENAAVYRRYAQSIRSGNEAWSELRNQLQHTDKN